MKKRFFVLFFAVFLMIVTAGCSDDPGDSSGSSLSKKPDAPSNMQTGDKALSQSVDGVDVMLVVPESVTGGASSGGGSTEPKIISSREELVTCIENIIGSYYRFFAGLEGSSARSVSARGTAASDMKNKIHEITDSVLKNFKEGGDGYKAVTGFFSGESSVTSFSFDNSIDYTNISIKDGVDTYIDFINYFDNAVNEASGSQSKPITAADYFGSNAQSVIDVMDKYASIPKLAAKLKINVNADAKTPDNSDIVLDTGYKVNAEIHDIDRLIKDSLEEWNSCNSSEKVVIPDSIDLPIKSISVGLGYGVNADVTRAQYKAYEEIEFPYREGGDYYVDGQWIEKNETIEEYRKRLDAWLETDAAKNITAEKCSCTLSFAVSVVVGADKNVPGGIITASFAKSYNDAKSFIRDFWLYCDAWDTSDLLYVIKQIDGGKSTALKVCDYNGKETYSLQSAGNVIEQIESIAEDINQNIGEIIQ